MRRRHAVAVLVAVLALGWSASPTRAQSVEPGSGGGVTVDNQAAQAQKDGNAGTKTDFGDNCRPGIPLVDDITEGACDVAKGAVDEVAGAPGKIAGKVAGGVLDQATEWMTDAAAWVSRQI